MKARSVQKYGPENSWAVASFLISSEVDQGAKELTNRWINQLEGVDTWAASHRRTALVYVEWDALGRNHLILPVGRLAFS